jgi:hypothetical protein
MRPVFLTLQMPRSGRETVSSVLDAVCPFLWVWLIYPHLDGSVPERTLLFRNTFRLVEQNKWVVAVSSPATLWWPILVADKWFSQALNERFQIYLQSVVSLSQSLGCWCQACATEDGMVDRPPGAALG